MVLKGWWDFMASQPRHTGLREYQAWTVIQSLRSWTSWLRLKVYCLTITVAEPESISYKAG